jgi:hypothetical protein
MSSHRAGIPCGGDRGVTHFTGGVDVAGQVVVPTVVVMWQHDQQGRHPKSEIATALDAVSRAGLAVGHAKDINRFVASHQHGKGRGHDPMEL